MIGSTSKSFRARAVAGRGGGLLIPLPFDPDAVWGKRPRHHVTGMVGACKVRGPLGSMPPPMR